MILYGIPNCDTVKKARTWLSSHAIEYEFHDYKKQGVDAALLRKWMTQHGWEPIINRQGQTWRKLSDAEKSAVHDIASALQLAIEKPSVIKRPAFEHQGQLILGFNPAQYETTLLGK
jgi:arsenate reductase (glutaredoxin)